MTPRRSDLLNDAPALKKLAAAVVHQRNKINITQEEAAHRASVALRTLQNLESGRLNPSYLTLNRIAVGLEISISKLLTGL